MRLSGLGNISPIQSRQPSAEAQNTTTAAASLKDSGEAVKSAVQGPKVNVVPDSGGGDVEAYRALQQHAPVERGPKLDFERIDFGAETARLEARIRTGTPSGVRPQPAVDAQKYEMAPVSAERARAEADVGTLFSQDL